MPYFGWRISQYGPPIKFKSVLAPRSGSTHTENDPNYPFRQVHEITESDYASLSLEQLAERYPYVRENEEQ